MPSVLLPIVDDFLAEHPHARVQFSVSDSDSDSDSDSINDVLREQVDVALRYSLVEEPGAVVRQLASLRRVPCASPAYLQRRGVPQSPWDLAER